MPANCANTSVGSKALTDFTPSELYLGHKGLLYPNSNTMPSAHRIAGLAKGREVQPLDAAGVPSASGKVVLLSLGMSNCNQIFDDWINFSASQRRSNIQLINGAIGGTSASQMDSAYFDSVEGLIATAGADPNQVQWVWMYTAEADEDREFSVHVADLIANMKAAIDIAIVRFPNLKGVSLSSREYAGYADLGSIPPSIEPWAYETGFAVKDLIEMQINHATTGDPTMDYDVYPWLGWGAYTWSDGEVGREYDDLVYVCADFNTDGVHPAPTGGVRLKVKTLLEEAFTTDQIMAYWYVGPMPVTRLGSTADNTDGTVYDTDAVYLPEPDQPVFAYIASKKTGAVANAPTTVIGNNIVWELVLRETYQTLTTERSQVLLYKGITSSPTNTVLTVTFPESQNACHISVFQVANSKQIDCVVQSVSNALDTVSSLPITLATPEHEDNLIIAGVAAAATAGLSFGDGWEPIHTLSSSGEAMRLNTAYAHYSDPTIVATLVSGSQHMGGIGAEVENEPEEIPVEYESTVVNNSHVGLGIMLGLSY